MAYTFERLSIRGFEDRPVPNLLLKQQAETGHLAVLFPGYMYTAGMPLLYYSGLQLLEHGADVLRVEYTYSEQPDFPRLSDEDKAARLRADAKAAVNAALAVRSYQQITLVGKSIGTRAMGEVVADPRLARARCVWLTPLLKSDALLEQIEAAPHAGLFVSGSADSLYHPARQAALAARPGNSSLVIANADHSLEVAGSFWASMDALQSYLRALEIFLKS